MARNLNHQGRFFNSMMEGAEQRMREFLYGAEMTWKGFMSRSEQAWTTFLEARKAEGRKWRVDMEARWSRFLQASKAEVEKQNALLALVKEVRSSIAPNS